VSPPAPQDPVAHLAHYPSLDVELGFIRDHRDVMAVLRDVVAGMVASIADSEATAMELPPVPAEIPIVHFADALELAGKGLGEDLSAEPDLAPAHERWLGEWAR